MKERERETAGRSAQHAEPATTERGRERARREGR